jgi:hypothetical protein
MSKINGRNKGASFERKVAKLISLWWGVDAHRTPGSGGLHWKRDNRVSGDIVIGVDGEDYPFSNECKKVEGWNFEQLIKGTGEVTAWWAQCTRDAKEVGKIPLLVFSKNRSPIYFMIPYEDYVKLDMKEQNYFITTFELDDVKHTVVVGFFDDLLSIPKDEVVKRLSS